MSPDSELSDPDSTRGRRWLVDGMNVIGSRPDRWWNDPDRAMQRMAEKLDAFAASTGDEVTVVFDKPPSRVPETPDLKVVVARWKGRNAADNEIHEMVARHPDPGSLRVVTSDKRLVEKVEWLGARVVPAGRFRSRLERVPDRPGTA